MPLYKTKKDAEKLAEVKDLIQEMKALYETNPTHELLQHIKNTEASMSGATLSFWLPDGLIRKLIMLALVLVGIYGLLTGGGLLYLIPIVLAATFSPRLIGELMFALGRYQAGRDSK